MSTNPWGGQTGLGRVMRNAASLVVLHEPNTGQATPALVDGREYTDLPELLGAAGGDAARITRGDSFAMDPEELLSPVGRPRKIICVGQNYLAHVHEGGRPAPPEHPDLFAKWDNALAGPYADVALPPESTQIDFESELAVVIGRTCRRVAQAAVRDVVFGYTAANDGSVRDFQFHTTQRTAGKAWDGLTPLGPVVVPAAALGGDSPDLQITGLLNDEPVQEDRTSHLIFGLPRLISYITTFMTLEPGDIILTGTPAGVGAVRQPPLFLKDGDQFEVRIEGIGAIRNTYRAETLS
ncbi:fumarylacetoacetate hydrolase family protein [Angustibacter luteus]